MRSHRAVAFAVQPLLLGTALTGLTGAVAQAATAAAATSMPAAIVPSQLPGLLAGLKELNTGISDTYLENADGGNMHTFASRPTDGGRVTWSPDGDWMNFVGGSGEGYVVHPDGSGGIPSDADTFGTGSAFTPDSANIVYGEYNGLAVQLAYTPTTCSSFNVTTGKSNNCSKSYFASDTGGNDHNVSISAASVVYFQHDTMANLNTVAFSDIWSDHGTKTPSLLISNGTEPSISPDGTQIAFVRVVGGHQQVFVQAADGSGTAVQETSDAAEHYDPNWRPDGTGLFYTYNPSTQNVNNVAGHQLTFTGGTTTDTLVPGGLWDVTQQPLAAQAYYHAFGPQRLLDTRHATGVPTTTPLPPGGNVTLTVAGAQGIPASGVRAVVLNVTVTAPTQTGYLTTYADGQPAPTTSNLNFAPGQTVANLVTVPVIDGKVTFHNGSGGTVHVVADAFGYYMTSTGAATSADNTFTAVSPMRVMDTRNGTGVRAGAISGGSAVTLKLGGVDPVPADATAVVLNLTATQGTVGGYLTVYPTNSTHPTTSNLNFNANETRPNLVVVPLGANGSINIYSVAGQVNAIADLMGYFTSATAVGTPNPSKLDLGVPTRVLDTRHAIGVSTTTPVPANSSVTLSLPGLPVGTTAVILNVTVTGATSGGYLTVYPGAGTAPTTSNLNFSKGETIPNLVIAAVTDGKVSFYNGGPGTVHVVADLFGAYAS